jgi:hypothetical protein
VKSIAFPEPVWTKVDAVEPAPPVRARRTNWGFPELFVIGQTVLPALLFFHFMQPLRLPIRIGAFVGSLVALGMASRGARGKLPPSSVWLVCAFAYLMLMVFHPNTNTFLAGIAQAVLYLAVMAPVFWAPGMIRNALHVRRLLWLLLVLNGINSAVGVLQVYDPNRWLPKELTTVDFSGVVQLRTMAPSGVKLLTYKGREGESIIRPPGLFDSPGAVAGPGMFAGLIGLAFFISSREGWKKAAALFLAMMGVSVIYLTQVRTSLVVLLGMILVYFWALLIIRKAGEAASLLSTAAIIVVASFSLALFLGGGSIRDRFATLVAKNPADVYYANRGEQLESGVSKFVVQYPLGAGLARWGMMRHYFGNPWNLNSTAIWAEVQFPAWLLDGGVILMVLYSVALIASLRQAILLLVRGRTDELRRVAALVLAVNAGTAALTLSFTPFTTQVGLQFWLLCGALHGAAETEFAAVRAGERPAA